MTGRLRPTTMPPAPGPSGLATEVAGARVFEECTIPRTNVTGVMRLLSRGEGQAVDAATRNRLAELGYATGLDLRGYQEWHNELATRTLAWAVRSPADPSLPLASLSEWLECDDNQIAALFTQYQDLEAKLDPFRDDGAHLGMGEFEAIRAAAKKKDRDLLRSYGSRKLASYLTTTDEAPTT